ncbi:probable protein phosphatase 2C 6 [Parasteatoda tepidariorum]|uniref:probable protein phosphatase 2C 6 n=1 Tax=Parasteatoda tepidariorum TaxID=114398 RepID=UPI00077F9FC2|nr:probable protein phosphatase 2C 6 [Parasteatoda tepidariorum]
MYAIFAKFINMGAHLSPYGLKPVLECSGEEGAGKGLRYGATAMQGWRKNQEDAYKCEVDLVDDFNYFGVFDGHGGSEVAKYLQKKLHKDVEDFLGQQKDPELALQLAFLACDASLRDPIGLQELNEMVEADNKATIANIEKNRKAVFNMAVINNDGAGCSKDVLDCSLNFNSLKGDIATSSDNQDDVETMSVDESEANPSTEDNADCQMDTLKYLLKDDLETSDPEDDDFDVEDEESSSESGDEETFEDMENLEPGVHSGSTGTVLLIGSKHYYCANVGDSRCVLSRGGEAIDLSIDHKPDDPEEMKRINATGSVVSEGRINKSLNLSRAFGDFYYKDASLAPFEQCVTVEPSITTLAVEEKDEFIIVASDGIWNSMSSQEVVDFITMRLKEEENLRIISEELFRLIISPDTSGDGTGCDNMTCILIKLNPSEFNHSNASESQLTGNSHISNSVQLEQVVEK